MQNCALMPVGTPGASQGGTLVIEQFLMENYRFRRNILNGKVEFAILPKAEHSAQGNTLDTIGSLSCASNEVVPSANRCWKRAVRRQRLRSMCSQKRCLNTIQCRHSFRICQSGMDRTISPRCSVVCLVSPLRN